MVKASIFTSGIFSCTTDFTLFAYFSGQQNDSYQSNNYNTYTVNIFIFASKVSSYTFQIYGGGELYFCDQCFIERYIKSVLNTVIIKCEIQIMPP